MQKAHLTYADMNDLWQLIHDMSATRPHDYQTQWVPYLSQFEQHWHRALTTCTSMHDLEQAIAIAPFARFGLSLSLQTPDHDQLGEVFANPALRRVCELDMYGVPIQHDDAKLIAQCEMLDQLMWLELTGCWLDASCCAVLCQSDHFGALRVFRLADGDIQNEGVAHLASADNMPSLVALSVANNEIDDDGIATLVMSPLFSRLVALDLGHNFLTERGAQLLLNTLPSSQLKALALDDTNIDTHNSAFEAYNQPIEEWMYPFGEHYG